MKGKTLIIVAGPTAVGKTDLCVQLAQAFDTVVFSADSRQFYREMSIGTAKPNAEEMQGVPHFFVNDRSVEEPYSAGDYEVDALRKLSEQFQHHDEIILTGGSGLYLQAVCEGIDDMPPIPEEIRQKWHRELDEKGIEHLQQMLLQIDPEYHRQVDLQNPQRLLRALEVHEVSGKTLSSYWKERKKRNFRIIKIALERDREELYERINRRMDLMIEKGLFKEAEALYPLKHLNALQTVGYKEIFDYMNGKHDYEEAVRLLKRNSRRYAKKQMTWFKRDPEFHWFHPRQLNDIVACIQAEIEKGLK